MNIFKQYFRSLYSPKDIALFRFQGIGKSILYVFFLTLLFSLPNMIYYSKEVATVVSNTKQTFRGDVPSFVIENGTLSSENKKPYIKQNGSTGLIIDASGTVEVSEVQELGATIAFLENEVVLRAGGNEEVVPYSMLVTPISSDDIQHFIKFANESLGVFIFILVITLYLTFLGTKFLEVTFLAFFGLFLKNILGRKLQYRHLWRMAACSITMSTTFFALMSLLKTPVPYTTLINWFVSSTILLLAMKEIPLPKRAQ
ncbi:DUF1189 domain-containing protein [Bacillus massilinigeriensis]|uniref:DUF1189 domain-containing protein n=1 Tax=Bacillus mediterraneensis TaxID=1805474 RepID=UPI0008F8596F|nr:DUF1189 domain-containing protein [Bacillus mediterraneensis]